MLFTHRNAVMFLLINICPTQLFMLKQITAACFTSDPAVPITYRGKNAFTLKKHLQKV
jgi:hypothetical protein